MIEEALQLLLGLRSSAVRLMFTVILAGYYSHLKGRLLGEAAKLFRQKYSGCASVLHSAQQRPQVRLQAAGLGPGQAHELPEQAADTARPVTQRSSAGALQRQQKRMMLRSHSSSKGLR